MRSLLAVATLITTSVVGIHQTPVQHPVHMKVEAQRVFDPLTSLPPSVQLRFKCVAYVESRNKLVDTNVVSGTQGLYQIQVYLWQYARNFIIGLPPTPNQASKLQQDDVAYFYYQRNNGLYPEWIDGC